MQDMSTAKTLQISSISSDNTERIAEAIGKRLKGGECLELVSDLGGGKTTFVRGLARGAGSGDKVNSPTFTLSKVYQAGKLQIHHFDFYNLSEPGLAVYELQDLLRDPDIVLVLEWGEIVEDVLPVSTIRIDIARAGDDERVITVSYPASNGYLFEEVAQ